jgi:hypothetical protein
MKTKKENWIGLLYISGSIALIAGIANLIIEKSIDSVDRSTRGVLSQLQCAKHPYVHFS